MSLEGKPPPPTFVSWWQFGVAELTLPVPSQLSTKECNDWIDNINFLDNKQIHSGFANSYRQFQTSFKVGEVKNAAGENNNFLSFRCHSMSDVEEQESV